MMNNKMNLNDREIIYITYSTERNWANELPKSNWLCVLVDNDRPRNYLDEVINKVISNDVVWISTVGTSCEKTHDLIDDEIQFREEETEESYLPEHDIMTTWHTDFENGIWFSIFAANYEEISIDKIVVLDMTENKERERIERLIEEFSR
jgi:hypothetical protein